MSFWTYCEKVSGFVGSDLVVSHISMVRIKWNHNKTVIECVDAIRESEGNRE